LAFFVPTRWRWIAAIGAAGAAGWWVFHIAKGCDEEFDVACDEQPLLLGALALMMLGSWLCGVGAGVLARLFVNRFVKPS
jgi:hypothetical protein